MPDLNYWKQRWNENQIGFHRPVPHDILVAHYHLISHCKTIFVPLAGKSPDLIYLLERGHEVIAVECCQKAVLDFFSENNLKFERELVDSFEIYHANNLNFYCGDLFNMGNLELAHITALYDRGAMIALDRLQREKYANLICYQMPNLKYLLSSQIDYGVLPETFPPYSIQESELQELYGEHFLIKQIELIKNTVVEERFGARGATFQQTINYLFSANPNKLGLANLEKLSR